MKRFIIALSLGVVASERTQAAPPVHIVIPEDKFSEHLARDGAIAAVPTGTLMRISFDYGEYDALHPYPNRPLLRLTRVPTRRQAPRAHPWCR